LNNPNHQYPSFSGNNEGLIQNARQVAQTPEQFSEEEL